MSPKLYLNSRSVFIKLESCHKVSETNAVGGVLCLMCNYY